MKNKGFTLVELLLTLAILAVMGIVVGVGVVTMLQKQNAKEFENFKKSLENAACVYVADKGLDKDRTTNGIICTNDLLEAGYIKKNMVNPQNNEPIENNNYSINVYWVNNEKKCDYVDASCDKSTLNPTNDKPTEPPTSEPKVKYWNDSFANNKYPYPNTPSKTYSSPDEIPEISTKPIYIRTDETSHAVCIRYFNKDVCLPYNYGKDKSGDTIAWNMNNDMGYAYGITCSSRSGRGGCQFNGGSCNAGYLGNVDCTRGTVDAGHCNINSSGEAYCY